MKPKDIIGKEFTCFKFELPDKLIQWNGKNKSAGGYIWKYKKLIEIVKEK